jgi:hypothetical protein
VLSIIAMARENNVVQFFAVGQQTVRQIITAITGVLLINIVPGMVVAQGPNLPVFTSPIDITGFQAQLHAIAPDRNTGRPIEVAIPAGVLGPKFNQFLATPLSAQFDQYWAVIPDAKTHLTPKDEACSGADGISAQIQAQIHNANSALGAYDVTCDLASTGKLLLQQEGATLFLAYLLTNNKINFNVSTPVTCHAGHGTPVCPTDPHISVTFATEIETVLRASGVCQLHADGATVVTQAVTIDGNHNLAGAVATAVDDLFLNHKISAVERSIESTEKPHPLPLDGYFKELRDSDGCTGKNIVISRNLQAFNQFETSVERRAIVFRMTHGAIAIPTLDVPDPGGHPVVPPTFTRPTISTNRPSVPACAAVSVSGRFFPFFTDLTTHLPVSIGHDVSSPCSGGGTDLQWGPAGKPLRIQRVSGTVAAPCPSVFDATGLTPLTGYQFSARDCDAVTCSLWSKTVKGTTAKVSPDHAKVVLTLDGVTPLGTVLVSDHGAFDTNVTIPAGIAAGNHKLRAVNGETIAEVAIGVTGAATAGKASIMMVGILPGESGCPNHPISSTQTDANFLLFGTGFGVGTVAIHLDSATGFSVGSAVAQADGSFCQKMVGVPSSRVGTHVLMAVQNGVIRAQTAVTVVVVSVIH